MVLDPIPQSLPVHFFGSRPQPPTSQGDASHICNTMPLHHHATCMPLHHAITSCHTQVNALDLNESCRLRWVSSFQQTLRMLWEAHAHRSAEGSDGTRTSRSARQGASRAVESMGNVDRASRCHLVVADTVPPFLESPPSPL